MSASLNRVLSLPWLVFYGVGVTVGAGIFALIGEVLRRAGDGIVYSFVMAAVVAAVTAFSYMLLAQTYPKAAGAAHFTSLGLGRGVGRIVGYVIVLIGILSSAVIGLAFATLLASSTGFSEPVCFSAIVIVMCAIAAIGVRESVGLAALITCVEVGALLLVIFVAFRSETISAAAIAPPSGVAPWGAAVQGTLLAFFAFIGFESIANLSEEAKEPERTVPHAIILTLIITLGIYVLVALAVAGFADRNALVAAPSPLAYLYEKATGGSGAIIAAMATIAMVNGLLVQIIMASRVLYGMADDHLAPQFLATVHETRRTPIFATLLAGAGIILLGLFVPIVELAEYASGAVLLIYALVNVSLIVIGGRVDAAPRLKRWRWIGVPGALLALALIAANI
jgi:basic amino acid/polyamine antiporter, APA family